MAEPDVPAWIQRAYRKHLKHQGITVVEFRTRMAETLDRYHAAVKANALKPNAVPLRRSSWIQWTETHQRSYRSQGYETAQCIALIQERFFRQLRLATDRAQAATEFHRQRQQGGYF